MSGEEVVQLLEAVGSRPAQLDVLDQARPQHNPEMLMGQLAAAEWRQDQIRVLRQARPAPFHDEQVLPGNVDPYFPVGQY